MPQFVYKAINAEKKVVSGTISANTPTEGANSLSAQGLVVFSIAQKENASATKGKLPIVEKITFCRYMGIMLQTGLSLTEGIEVLARETKHPVMKRILAEMSAGLEQGQPLSHIFERFPAVFEPYFLTLMRAGEVSGNLAEVFNHLEAELRAEHSLKSKVKSALMYPAIIFIAMIGIGIMMFFFVLPQIGKVFLNLKLPLPAITKFLFQVSIFMSSQMLLIAVLTIVMIVAGVFALRTKQAQRIVLHILTIVPVVRALVQKIDIARFCRIFSTLIKSAVPITEALELSVSLLSYEPYRIAGEAIPNEVRKGRSLAQAMKERSVFPSLLVQMVAAGEKTATLDATLGDVASFYEGEVEEEVKGLTQIIEPVMMLLVGISVGLMILSIIAPIYSVVGSFQTGGGP